MITISKEQLIECFKSVLNSKDFENQINMAENAALLVRVHLIRWI
ncbi:hypothetical protein [Paenibacillus polymyxa]